MNLEAIMAYLRTKITNGTKYYYVAESKRINGKPRTVNQVYLGTIEQLIALKTQSDQSRVPQEVAVYEFGLAAACFHLAQKLNIAAIIDHHVPKRKQGLSIGQYLVIAAISRAIEPVSKSGCWDWFRRTCLPRLFETPVRKNDLSSQQFWNQMDKIPLSAIPLIEQDISRKVLSFYDLDMRFLIYDTTNYYTYIDSFNDRNKIAKRGNNKQKRNDLRQVNLALAATRDFHIPLFHKLYEGNQVDSTSFFSIVDELVDHYKLLGQYCEDITLIYDKGNNSLKNQKKVDQSDYHFIGSLKLSQCPELAAMETGSDLFEPLEDDRLTGVTAYRTTKSIYAKERTLVMTFSETFYKKQAETIRRDIIKARARLDELGLKLKKRMDARTAGKAMPGTPPTRQSVESQVKTILSRQYMKNIFQMTISEHDGLVSLSYELDEQKLSDIQKTRLGKTILFTDQDEWMTADIILGYRGQYAIEDAFKVSKKGHFMAWQPPFHWTDQKLHIHALYCMLSLLFVSLIQRQVDKSGLKIGLSTLEDELRSIKEVLVIQKTAQKGKPRFCRILTKMESQQEAIFKALELEKWAPN